MSTNRSLCQRKTDGGLEKRFANLWRRNKVRKKARAGRGQEIKWEIPDYPSNGLSDYKSVMSTAIITNGRVEFQPFTLEPSYYMTVQFFILHPEGKHPTLGTEGNIDYYHNPPIPPPPPPEVYYPTSPAIP
jgi:hypothetical protein